LLPSGVEFVSFTSNPIDQRYPLWRSEVRLTVKGFINGAEPPRGPH
jgi:hypothetical protein